MPFCGRIVLLRDNLKGQRMHTFVTFHNDPYPRSNAFVDEFCTLLVLNRFVPKTRRQTKREELRCHPCSSFARRMEGRLCDVECRSSA